MKQKQINDAEKFYLKIFKEFTDSEYLGPATYRLGSIYYSNNKFQEAVTFFNTAKATLDKKSVQLSATYYHARSLNETKQFGKALSAFEKLSIIENEKKNGLSEEIFIKAKTDFLNRLEKIDYKKYYLEEPFKESGLALYHWSPIADELKELDKKIVLNSIKLKWNLIVEEFAKLTKNLKFN